jgi:type IV secretory pathway TraG/TraD family ATPase VirD4
MKNKNEADTIYGKLIRRSNKLFPLKNINGEQTALLMDIFTALGKLEAIVSVIGVIAAEKILDDDKK